ncbi:MAG TPA: hypothetical protein VLR49_03130, partial [Ferruginibacter sp.]|nr:hypothetical protein [Ferruginibacter sp.]
KEAPGLFFAAKYIMLGDTSVAKILKSGLFDIKYLVMFPGPHPIYKISGCFMSKSSQKIS